MLSSCGPVGCGSAESIVDRFAEAVCWDGHHRDGLRAGSSLCPAGALTPGWDVINDELRQAVRELRSTQVLWLTGVLGGLLSGRKSATPVGATAAADSAGSVVATAVAATGVVGRGAAFTVVDVASVGSVSGTVGNGSMVSAGVSVT